MMIDIGMGSVQVGECDVMGHMNVRHYVSRALEALDWLGLELGLGPSYTREHGATLAPADQHIRFVRELPAGTPFSIHGGVVHRRGNTLRLYQEIRNAATGAVAATIVTDAALADASTGAPRPLLPDIAAATARLKVSVPDYAAPRGLRFDPPHDALSLEQAVELGLSLMHKGSVQLAECNEHGLMRADGVISRIWDGVPNSPARGVRQQSQPIGKIGSAALEYRLVYHRPVRAGDLLTVRSGLKAVGSKTTTWAHWLFNGQSGAAVAVAEAVGIAFDLTTRKAVSMEDEVRRALEEFVVPSLSA
ncbi:acyl-ACP thioesterase [Belnapia sp. T18]|uniref:Acyl-ACP thioesterase n=1 Tax=Belnapia arida TaxID=2804533 RepID=A0ABS1UDG6_9PROT|nr:thioesterase family protein [Belnapia arida]MBL6082737.1 acyl-ACP thioesterase [Belnapia arida]